TRDGNPPVERTSADDANAVHLVPLARRALRCDLGGGPRRICLCPGALADAKVMRIKREQFPDSPRLRRKPDPRGSPRTRQSRLSSGFLRPITPIPRLGQVFVRSLILLRPAARLRLAPLEIGAQRRCQPLGAGRPLRGAGPGIAIVHGASRMTAPI